MRDDVLNRIQRISTLEDPTGSESNSVVDPEDLSGVVQVLDEPEFPAAEGRLGGVGSKSLQGTGIIGLTYSSQDLSFRFGHGVRSS